VKLATSAWLRRADVRTAGDAALVAMVGEFVSRVSDAAFPCPFAAGAISRDELVFASVRDLAQPVPAVASRITELTRLIAERPMTVGALFVTHPGAGDVAEETAFVTELLDHLADPETTDWPAAAPRDRRDPRWSLWVRGVELFMNVSSPGHGPRRSRNLGRAVTLLVQWRGAFDDYPAGHPVRQSIRRRVEAYDGIPPHPALGAFGDEDNHEADQYYLGPGNGVTHHLERRP